MSSCLLAKIPQLGLVGGANLAYGHCRQAVQVDYIDGTKLPNYTIYFVIRNCIGLYLLY